MEPRRNQLNLQGLLKFALNQTKNEDTTNKSDLPEMDNERREFLENAFKAMTVDVMEEFQKAITILEDESSSSENKVEAINLIRDYIENIDFAISFVKVGGANIILKCIQSSDPQVKTTAIYVIAEMSQNNPYCQNYFVSNGVISLLIPNFANEIENIACSSLHAVSALIRNFPAGLIEFLKSDGIKSIKSSLNTNHSRVFIKACFLIACLSFETPDVRDEFVKKQTISALLNRLELVKQYDVKMETLLFALSELSKSDEAKHSNSNSFQETHFEILQQTIDNNIKLPECEEIVNYSRIILNNIKKL